MFKFIRNALTTIFFAASFSSLALWGWTTIDKTREVRAHCISTAWSANFLAVNGAATFYVGKGSPIARWEFDSREMDPYRVSFAMARQSRGVFANFGNDIHFPLWYAALVCALVGVGVLRFRRQFSIRSALLGLAVVAALLGMIVAL